MKAISENRAGRDYDTILGPRSGVISAAGDNSQYQAQVERIEKALSSCRGEASMLLNTLQVILPHQPETTGSIAKDEPPGHPSPMMLFLKHIERQLQEHAAELQFIRVRTPF